MGLYHQFKMSTEIKNNYYEILEVSQTASQHEITVAYEKARRTYSAENSALHSVFTTEEAQSLRELIDEAYNVLSHHSYRDLYEKRVQSKSYSESDLSLVAIKKASQDLFNQNSLTDRQSELAQQDTKPNYDTDPSIENEIKNCSQWTGDTIKRIREYKKYSLELLHEKTKVNPWYLAALENMEPKSLPAPVYVRGYIVQMAKTLGLNEKEVAESYMKIYKQKLEQSQK